MIFGEINNKPMLLTPATYHSDTTHISKSGLDLINRAPAHYWQKYLNPNRQEVDETQAFMIGSALHRATTEPETFFDRYIVSPKKIDRRYKEGQEQWQEFLLASEGKTILQSTSDEKSKHLSYDQIMYMRDAIRNHKSADLLLRNGVAEQIYTWVDPITGMLCKSMQDWKTRNILVDIKTTEDASEDGFVRSIYKYRYDVQAAFYTDGLFEATGQRISEFIFIAIEKKPPYICEVWALHPDDIDAGREKYLKNLNTYKECLQTGVWGGYTDGKINRIRVNKI